MSNGSRVYAAPGATSTGPRDGIDQRGVAREIARGVRPGIDQREHAIPGEPARAGNRRDY